ncbi:MAG: polymer-forming cytoskeletal protein [Phycisphaeraceae bacterium]|nr:polymer-forming cytoskeletal protein [Phycisphaeraceae bacterium]
MPDQNVATVIGADTTIKGEMTFESTAKLLGTIEGQVIAKGEFQVADGAICRAAVEAGKVIIDGTVEGNVTARDRVELSTKARLKGDLVAAKLVVAEGASFVGHCRIGPEVSAGSNGRATVAEAKPQAQAERAQAVKK